MYYINLASAAAWSPETPKPSCAAFSPSTLAPANASDCLSSTQSQNMGGFPSALFHSLTHSLLFLALAQPQTAISMNAWCLLMARDREVSPESALLHALFMSMMLGPEYLDTERWTYHVCSQRTPSPPPGHPASASLITHPQSCRGNARPLPDLHQCILSLGVSWLSLQIWLRPEGSAPVIPDKLLPLSLGIQDRAPTTMIG